MKILVFAHQLVMGGTVVNAVDLAAALRDLHGHDVTLFASPGPLLSLVRERGLRYIPAPDARFHPTPALVRALREAVRSERPDLLHAWDWWQCIDAYYAVHLPMSVPMIVSDMTMEVTRLLPKGLPTTFGTPELVDQARAMGRRRVELLLPPVDVHQNEPGAVDPQPFRERFDIARSDTLVVTVSRLAEYLKGESLLRTVDAVRTVGRHLPLKYVIVGDGTLRGRLERLAVEVNGELGRRAVVLAGALLDPRPAYAAADIVVGMGGSALRGMAFGKPTVIAGEQGFSAPFTPETAERFHYTGMYGRGDGDLGSARLAADIGELAGQPDRLPGLGEFSLRFVRQHFSVEAVSAHLAEYSQRAVSDAPSLRESLTDGLRTAAIYFRERRFLIPSRDASRKGTWPAESGSSARVPRPQPEPGQRAVKKPWQPLH
jgi:L-malate glycosyltransferase